MSIESVALVRYLEPSYRAKILELRELIKEWLSYVPQTFRHYTRHTTGHSEEIILQLSHLLFYDDDPNKPSVPLSHIEAFVLCAAAYLHDAGMVCSDSEKIGIIQSAEWQDWISEGAGGAERWKEIASLRTSLTLPPHVRDFVADIQVRFLISEFVRARHHLRAGELIAEHQSALARVGFDDPILTRTIADVCVAHGLERKDLEESDRFPEQRDIRGEKINVRFIAILLRLGDLLDMSSDRACPLLLNPASPIPADSLAHWTQYQRIVHRSTSPEAIEISARCQNQDEHRILHDWCQWIVDEVRNAAVVMPHAKRHADWIPPRATLDGKDASITIKPGPSANYIPSEWRLQFDEPRILERLIHDAHDDGLMFVRELIQNALDATRCWVYEQLMLTGATLPNWPTEIEEAILAQYPICVRLEERSSINQLSQSPEIKQVLTVEDDGTGMSQDIIERYFLQVGRSYYVSPEFRRRFPFHPTSRFGIGFLSTFAVSDEIHVDTFKPDDGGPGIRLTLTGPRNYLLMERSARNQHGTKIEVVLRQPFQSGAVKEAVRNWCRRVEFPIIVDELGSVERITAERPESFETEVVSALDQNEIFRIKAFPTITKNARGEIYIFISGDQQGERWDKYSWARYTYPKQHPMARAPELPGDLYCQDGIAIVTSDYPYNKGWSARFDVRGEEIHPDLFRTRFRWHAAGVIDREVKTELAKILAQYLESSPRSQGAHAWKYKQRLMDSFEILEYWRDVANTIPIVEAATTELVSIAQFEEKT